MEIRQLKAFVAIAESGTFTAAALRVHVTQAAISMQIRQLENELGAKLFVRAPRHVILTEAGEHLLHRARQILREHDAAIEEISELAGAERGRLRIGSASAMVLTDPLPKILKDIRTQHPRAEITWIINPPAASTNVSPDSRARTRTPSATADGICSDFAR